MPKFVNDIYEIMVSRKNLENNRRELAKHVADGVLFFQQQSKSPDSQDLINGISLVSQYLARAVAVDEEIQKLDIALITTLESGLNEYVVKAVTNEKITETGDSVGAQTLFFVPNYTGKPGVIEVTPSDLFFLKVMKDHFNLKNIEFIPKADYERL